MYGSRKKRKPNMSVVVPETMYCGKPKKLMGNAEEERRDNRCVWHDDDVHC